MSNTLKKIISIAVTVTTTLWSLGALVVPMAASADVCPANLGPGSLIKVIGKPAIYVLDSSNKYRYFPDGDVFKSWNADDSYSKYYTAISQDCLKSLNQPAQGPFHAPFRAGSNIVKYVASDDLFVVGPMSMLWPISKAGAQALYGTTDVKTIGLSEWPYYQKSTSTPLDGSKVHAGMLLSNGGKTWLVDGNSLREVSLTGMTANRFKLANAHLVTDAMIAGLTKGASIDAEVPSWTDRLQMGVPAPVVVVPAPVSTSTPSTSTSTPAVTGGNLTVALASDNPAAGILASGSAFNPVLKVVLTASDKDVTVTGLTVRKTGFLANSNVAGVDVIDSMGVRHGNVVQSLTSDGDAVLLFPTAPVVVKAGSTQTLLVRVNLGSGATSGTLQMNVLNAAAITSNGVVAGAFPVSGAVFSLQNGSTAVASTTISAVAINASGANLNVDPVNQQEIAKFKIAENGGQEGVKISKFAVYNNGTAADTDVKDVQLVAQDGTILATAQQSAKYVNFDLSSSTYFIDKGLNKNFTVRAKIVNGTGRTIQFVVYNNYDVYMVGANTGVAVLSVTDNSAGNSSANSFPVGNATNYNLVTVNSGTLSFNKDVSSPSAAVAPGASSVLLAKFFAKPTGEDMELRQISLSIVDNGTSPNASALTGVINVKVNSSTVWSGSPAATAGVPYATTTITLSSYPILASGQNNFITVESSVSSNATASDSFLVRVQPMQVRRVVTNDIIAPSVSAANANTIAVQAGAFKVTTLTVPPATSLAVGIVGAQLAQFELNPGAVSSGEDIKINKIVVTDVLSASTAGMNDVANLVLYDPNMQPLATSASTATNGTSTTFTFVNPIVVPKTGAGVYTLKGDVLIRTGVGSHTFSISAVGNVTATGVSTGNTITPTLGTGSGQAMTLAASGSVSLSAVIGGNAAPSSDQMVNVGSTGNAVFAFKLTAQYEPIKITSLKVTATGTVNTANDLMNLKLYRNSETAPFATGGQMTLQGTTSTSYTWTATDNLLPDPIQPGTSVTIYVKADVGGPSLSFLGDNFRFTFNTLGDLAAKGQSSGASVSVTGGAAVTAVSYIVPFAVNADTSQNAPSTGSSQTLAITAGTQIGRFKIMNSGTAQITVTSTKFTDNGNHTGSTTTYKLYYSDQNSSNFLGNTASSTMGQASNTSIDFTNLGSQGTSFTIDGGSYRYLTVAINTLGSSVSGDTWQLSIANIGDVKYQVTEANLGYDGNANAVITDTIQGLVADCRLSLGTLVKQ